MLFGWKNILTRLTCIAGAFGLFASAIPAISQDFSSSPDLTYVDLMDLSDGAELILTAQIRKQAELRPERAVGVQPGYTRLYIEARTSALLSGSVPVGESLRYLVDVPLAANGKAPKLKKRDVIVFARPVPGRPGEVQLMTRSSQILWSADRESRLRNVLQELVGPDAQPSITGIRDAFSISGNLAGESETQIFASTESDGPVSLSVIRRPGQTPVWGVSWTDIVDQAARPPERNTLAWYRLACFLPQQLPSSALMGDDSAARQQAQTDYKLILTELGQCQRNRS